MRCKRPFPAGSLSAQVSSGKEGDYIFLYFYLVFTSQITAKFVSKDTESHRRWTWPLKIEVGGENVLESAIEK